MSRSKTRTQGDKTFFAITPKFIVIYITIALYAFYALKTAWFAFDKLEYSPLFYYIGKILVILCFPFAVLTLITSWDNLITTNRALLLLPWHNWLFLLLNSYGNADLIRGTFTFFILIFFILFKAEIKRKIFELFYKIILYTNIISIIFYICYLLKLDIGFQVVNYYSIYQNASYIKWFIFAIFKNSSELRLCSIFNEPGALATVCALLFTARFKFSPKWEKLVMLVTILLTFSLAGYLIIFLFWAGYLVKKNKQNIILLVLFLVVFLLIPHIDFKNDALNRLASRFAITQHGLAGDNRESDDFAELFDRFTHSSSFWLGYGAGFSEFTRTLSYKTYIVQYGIVGFSAWILCWLKAGYFYTKRHRECFLFLLLFMISLYQRCSLLKSIYGYVLLFGGMEWIQQQEQHKNMQ